MNILVLNGPNLNMLGKREKEHYGALTLSKIEDLLKETYPAHSIEVFQSNNEGVLIERIHKATYDDTQAILCNFGGLTHSSVSLHDALKLFHGPKVEVHLSNIHAREHFRQHSVTAGACDGVIAGLAEHSYLLGIQAAEQLMEKKRG